MAPVAVTVLAAAARLANLTTQPGGLYIDEGAEALDAHKLLHVPGFHPVFFADDAGREALYGYIVAAAFRVFGESVIILRAVSGALGVLGGVATYLALRRFGRGVALAGMAWSAGALWLICVGHLGMRNILVPLFAALALWALLRWGDRPASATALAAGAACGAGLWTYQPLKLTPLLVVAWLAWAWWQDRPRFRQLLRGTGWFLLAYVVIAAPMLFTAITQPGLYFGRATGVSVFDPGHAGTNLLAHTVQTLLMFTTTGDPNQLNDISSLPLLGWPLFLVAVAGAVRAFRRRQDHGHALLLLGVLVFLVPPLLAIEGGTPHFLRSLGLAPFLAGLIGLGCVEIVDRAGALVSRAWVRPGAIMLLAAALVGLGAGSYYAYQNRPVADRYEAFSYNVVAAAESSQPGSAIIIDDYQAIDIYFLDRDDLPAVIAPGKRIENPKRYNAIIALSQKELVVAVGEDEAKRAQVVDRDPKGAPRVWVLRR